MDRSCCAAVALVVVSLAAQASAIDAEVHDGFRFALGDASTLCETLALSASYSARANLRLARARKSLLLATERAEAGEYLAALGSARTGVVRVDGAVRADAALRVAVYNALADLTEASRALVRAAIDEVAHGHAVEAGRASLPYARALAKQRAEEFGAALALLRKAFRKLARVLDARTTSSAQRAARTASASGVRRIAAPT